MARMAKISILRGDGGVEPQYWVKLSPSHDHSEASVLLSLGMPLASNGNLTCVRGGLPLIYDQTVVGGIGISAGTEDQDEEVARAGAEALQQR